MGSKRLIKTILLLAVLFCTGCGASVQQNEETHKCLQQCKLTSMDCLESADCTDESGQLIPCESECEQGRLECEDQC